MSIPSGISVSAGFDGSLDLNKVRFRAASDFGPSKKWVASTE